MTHCDDVMAERIAEFKNDPQKMAVANKFVSEVLEKAKDEAVQRMKDKGTAEVEDSEYGSSRRRPGWHTRARGLISRIISLCFCNSETKV